jgi:hypothetical protein
MASEKTEYTGTFKDGCPGNAGIVNCKCEIYANKPIFGVRQQDQEFIISHETLSVLPEELHDKLSSIPNVDGVFLREIHNYRSNYLGFFKYGVDFGEPTVAEFLYPNIVPLRKIEFLPMITRVVRGVPIFSEGVPDDKKEAPHQTWFAEGSIFSTNYQMRPSEYYQSSENIHDKIQRRFHPLWRYDVFVAPPSISVTNGTISSDGTYKFCPYQFANATESPVTLLTREEYIGGRGRYTSGDNIYRGINPGIHWSVHKRTPLFQGQDFWVEFKMGTSEPNILDHGNAIFNLDFNYRQLDVHAEPIDGNGVVINGGVVELDENLKVTDKSKELYDFARQSYFMINIGPYHPEHNYIIIIPEKDYPIFLHVGDVITLVPQKRDPAIETEETGTIPSENVRPASVIPKRALQRISRRLSSWKVAKGKTLMEDKSGIRVTVRNHMGSIIVTFAGYEDKPWVIDRFDYVEKEELEEGEELTEDNIQMQRTPMIIPAAKISLHGGNRQASFQFCPLQYYNASPLKLPQSLSILGPVEQENINLLLRDKGLSVHPSMSSVPREYEYSMDAEAFVETIEGLPVTTYAVDVQYEQVFKYGKAPYAQSFRDPNRVPSSIKIHNGNRITTGGSSNPHMRYTQAILKLSPGDYIFESPDELGLKWNLQSCITPITTRFRLYLLPSGTAYSASPVDVSHHVMSFSDSWTAKDFNLIEHTGRIQFLINEGMEFTDDVNYAPFLASLIDKNFYLQVSVWWEGGVMPKPVLARDRVMITGLCTGGTITVENGKKVLTCDIYDYYRILKDQKFLNSPFFDKMRDFNAVYEILKMASFRDVYNDDPASLLKRLAESDESGWFEIVHNGDPIIVNDYALPGSYDIIQQPFMRFSDGEQYSEGIERMATLSGKVAYFDRLGVFHFENLPFEQLFFNSEGVDYQTPVEEYQALSKIDFFVSPLEVETSDFHRQVFNSYTVKRNMEDVINEIHVVSTTPDGELLLAGHTNFDSLFSHDTPGFIGYPKQFLQMDGIFGSEAAVKYIVKHYTKMFVPPVTLTFEAFGHNKLKALDVITFQQLHSNEKQPLIIQSITSEVDPAKNTWMQNFECEWIFPATDINWAPNNIKTLP